MSTASWPPLVSLEKIRACTDVPSIAELLESLGYLKHPPLVATPIDPSSLPESISDYIAAYYPVARIADAASGGPTIVVSLFIVKQELEQTVVTQAIRSTAQIWTRRHSGEHIFIFATPEQQRTSVFGQLTFINTRRLGDGAQIRIKLHKLIIERAHPTRHDCETLGRISLPNRPIPATQLLAAIQDAFNVERITNAFYKEYARRFNAAMTEIRSANMALAAFSDATRLHAFTQRLFGRLMFLYFLQKKRALNDDPNFIRVWYDRATEHDENFYRTVLEPLFFQTLNKQHGPDEPAPFGRIPYLNGGLFAADEDDQVGTVYLDNALFNRNHVDGLLNFLESHNFTITEDTPLEVEVALDPEMLGKVFENLLEVTERGQSGTFYTPRPVVTYMCRQALRAYLLQRTRITPEVLDLLLEEGETGEPVVDDQGHRLLTFQQLTRPLREEIEQALKAVRVLDPAVGSGAFPLGMLALLIGVRRALYHSGGATVPPRSAIVEGWKRDFIRDCLYGVDIRREAVEIARLRLWLSLVVDADPFTMEPLPNLDYKLMEGNSLIETFQGYDIYPTRPPQTGITQTSFNAVQEKIQTLHQLQSAYFQPLPTSDRAALRQQIRDAECAIVDAALDETKSSQKQELERLIRQLNLNLAKKDRDRLNAQVAALREAGEITAQVRTDIRTGKPLPFFLYRLHFGNVFADRDGFDIVIANPPYVRHEKINSIVLDILKNTYPHVAHGMADLYTYFYARALQLLRPQGVLAFITSNKFFRAGYGEKLRDFLSQQTTMQTIVDFGDAPVFDAAAYPCIVITSNGAPAPEHTYAGLTATNSIDLEKLTSIVPALAQPMAQSDGVRPPAASGEAAALVARLLKMGTPLGTYVNGQIYYGIKTGLNEAFVVDRATRDRLIAEDPRSAELLKPFLRGRDIGRYHIASPDLWLIYISWHCNIQQYPAIYQHLSTFQTLLSSRPEVVSGRVPWYAMSRYASDYVWAFEQPKIIYAHFAQWPEVVYDILGFYCVNKAYILPTTHKWLVGVLSQKVISLVLSCIAPPVRGGFIEHSTIFMERLPIVEPTPADQAELESLVDRIQAMGGSDAPGAAALEQEIDAIVYRTYGLSDEEIGEIERWHAERVATLGGGRRRGKQVEEEGE